MNNGVNETTYQTTTGAVNAAPASTNANPTTASAVAAVHPQILASTGAAQASAIASVEAAGVQPPTTPVSEEPKKKEKVVKPKNKLVRVYFVIILALIGACGFLWYYHQQQMILMDIKCTPISTGGESKELDLNSTVVRDLYAKVKTSIREDLGESELNDDLKLYLAYRQVANSQFYDSHCKQFTLAGMEPFTCDDSGSFAPKAIKAEVIEVEYKKLFGEDATVPHGNIQLGNSCIGGYQYIEARGEYVQGQCAAAGATLYTVDKDLLSATSTESTIVLRERVKYYGNEGLTLPDRLISGTYEYTFKLDMNYNYVYKSKTMVS